MMPTLWKVLYALRNLLFMSIALLLCTSAVLELIFAPVMTFKYYGPSLFRSGLADCVMATFYTVCILVQLCNFLGALFLFVSILLTNYHEKWLAYDTLSLLSVSFSLSLITHHSLVGIDFYRSHVEKDIYKQVATIGDVHCTRRACIKTDVFTWHQDSQCCGWYSSNDLTGMFDPRVLERLPQFCCFQNTTQAMINVSIRNRTASVTTSASCEQGSIHRFQEPCSKNRTAFLMFRGLTYIGHPSSLPYSVFKVVVALAYTFVKKSSLFPQTEGIYSTYVTL